VHLPQAFAVPLLLPGATDGDAEVSGPALSFAEGTTGPALLFIRRPAGLVVYRLENDRVKEVPVTTGIRQGDRVEILSGVTAGDTLAMDGAAYLTDGVTVRIQQTNGQTGENEAAK